MAFKVDNGLFELTSEELVLTPKEAELFLSSCDKGNAYATGLFDKSTIDDAIETRKEIAIKLRDYYQAGDQEQGVTRDLNKVKKYNEEYIGISNIQVVSKEEPSQEKPPHTQVVSKEELSQEKSSQEKPKEAVVNTKTAISGRPSSIADWFASQFDSFIKGFNEILKTAIAYEALGWLTSFRLAVLRGQRLTKLADLFSQALATITTYGGLSYIIELLVDFGVILRTILFPALDEEKANPDWLSRAWNTFTKDDRPPRMANAAIWFVVNLTCFFISNGASAYLNAVLFFVDIVVDAYKWGRDWYCHHNLVKKLEHQIKLLEDKEKTVEEDEKIKIRNKIKQYDLHKLQVENQQKDNNRLKFYLLTVTTVIFVGMAIIYFPVLPTLLVCGSLLASIGIGSGFYEWTRKIREPNVKYAADFQKAEDSKQKSYLYAAAALTVVALAVIGLSFFPPAAVVIGSILAFMGCTFAGLGRRFSRQVETKKKDEIKTRTYVFAAIAVTAVVLACVFFPPIPALIVASSVFAVTASVFVDLGSKLYDKAKPFLASKFPTRFSMPFKDGEVQTPHKSHRKLSVDVELGERQSLLEHSKDKEYKSSDASDLGVNPVPAEVSMVDSQATELATPDFERTVSLQVQVETPKKGEPESSPTAGISPIHFDVSPLNSASSSVSSVVSSPSNSPVAARSPEPTPTERSALGQINRAMENNPVLYAKGVNLGFYRSKSAITPRGKAEIYDLNKIWKKSKTPRAALLASPRERLQGCVKHPTVRPAASIVLSGR